MIQAKFVEKRKAHILCLAALSENHYIYGVMCKNMLDKNQDTDENIILRMRVA